MGSKRILRICFFLVLFSSVFPQFAYAAYLDPGTGSYIFQLIIAGIVGLAFMVKIYWNKIVAFLGGLFSRDTIDEDA